MRPDSVDGRLAVGYGEGPGLLSTRFPYFAFNPRHNLGAGRRLSALCEYALKRRMRDLRVDIPIRPHRYIYRSMVSAGSFDMTVLSLVSLARCSETMPKIELCTNEALAPEKAQSILSAFGFEADVWTPEDLDEAMAERGEELLRLFAKDYFWGRKTAFTFGLDDSLPVLYADPDVLWFKDPFTEFEIGRSTGLVAGTDHQHSYDSNTLGLLSEEDRQRLMRSEPVCAGIYSKSPTCALPREILFYIDKELERGNPGWFCEQTLIALAVKIAGRQLCYSQLPTCPVEEIACSASYRGKGWVAAHYAGATRAQFWRDVYAHRRKLFATGKRLRSATTECAS